MKQFIGVPAGWVFRVELGMDAIAIFDSFMFIGRENICEMDWIAFMIVLIMTKRAYLQCILNYIEVSFREGSQKIIDWGDQCRVCLEG